MTNDEIEREIRQVLDELDEHERQRRNSHIRHDVALHPYEERLRRIVVKRCQQLVAQAYDEAARLVNRTAQEYEKRSDETISEGDVNKGAQFACEEVAVQIRTLQHSLVAETVS